MTLAPASPRIDLHRALIALLLARARHHEGRRLPHDAIHRAKAEAFREAARMAGELSA